MIHVSRNSSVYALLEVTFAEYTTPELWLLRYAEHRGPGGGQDHVRRAPKRLS